MHLIFLRHGQRATKSNDAPLTALGHEQAAAAGGWLLEQGIVPTHVKCTETPRTQQTAASVLTAMGLTGLTPVIEPGMPVRRTWEARLARWQSELPPDAVLLAVCHGVTQDYAQGRPGAEPIPKKHRCGMFVLQQIAGEWRVVRTWPGMAGD